MSVSQSIAARAAILLTAALMVTACTIGKQSSVPPLTGPSEFGLSISMSAAPDILSRDGSSPSTISVTARNADGSPKSGQTFVFSSTAGTLAPLQATTNGSGTAQVTLTAPAAGVNVTKLTVTATPVGSNFENSHSQSLSIALSGPTIPGPDFTFTPVTPGQFDAVTFDATPTTLNGSVCGVDCTYSWDFGDGATASGQLVSHRFDVQGTFRVTLSVTGPAGLASSVAKNVTVGKSAGLTVNITLSPTNPKLNTNVQFDGRSSTTPDGATIASYAWDFGGGNPGTANTATAVTQFPAVGSYTVRLTITDSVGRTATTTITVNVT